jgi:hypothetical protein
MADDRLLAEILQSPLDDMAPRGDRRWLWSAGALIAFIVLVGGFLTLRSGDGAPETPAVAPDGAPTELTADAAVETVTTEALAQVYPAPGFFHEMVAVGGGHLLMFGGLEAVEAGTTVPFEGTWTFDVATGDWAVDEPEVAPSTRFGHALALHPPTGKVYLFGGGAAEPRPCPRTRFCAGPEDNQVWRYDPATGIWEDRTPPVTDPDSWPVARFGVRFVYEPVTERFIMFSGVGVFGERFTPTFYEDTWAYDPVSNQWEDLTDLEAAHPIGRTTYGMAWDAASRRVMLFAGDSLSGTDDDHLWAFDPETASWEDLGVSEMGPIDRWYHLLTSDPQSGRLVMIGGTGSILTPIQGGSIRNVGRLDEVWTWSEAEGWIALNRMEEPMSPVAGAGDPGSLAVIAYDGHDVMSYDVALDQWTSIAHREDDDE